MEIGLFIVRRIFPSQIAPIPRDYQVERARNEICKA